MRALRLSIMALALSAAALAGCGDDDNDNSGGEAKATTQQTSPAGANAGTVRLSETEFKITPSKPSVKSAGTVTFSVSNDGGVVHALEVEGPGEEKETPNIDPGKSATLKVDLSKPGTYEMYCPIDGHKQQGMTGEIKVAGGGAGSTDEGETTDDEGGKSGY
jgi:uncharacterized cupredoxin-like copper-binding protein